MNYEFHFSKIDTFVVFLLVFEQLRNENFENCSQIHLVLYNQIEHLLLGRCLKYFK